MNTLGKVYLESAIRRLISYKELGEKTFAQLEEKDFFFRPNEESNSITLIIQHLSGNMLSRWTNFLTEDGEKSWRQRDKEFSPDPDLTGRELVLELWEKGWNCLLGALQSLTEDDLGKTIYIRSEPLSVIDAINRQLAHYPYHVGQIIYIGKLIRNTGWQSLSIPRDRSEEFNKQMRDAGGEKE